MKLNLILDQCFKPSARGIIDGTDQMPSEEGLQCQDALKVAVQ